MSTETIPKTEIQGELVGRQKNLEAQIEHLDKFVTDLISHKLSLENANRQIEKLAQAETDAGKRGKYYTTLRVNIELLTKIFDSIAKLENIKHSYHKEIDDVIGNKYDLIAVKIRKLDETITGNEGDLVTFFEKLGTAMAGASKGNTPPVETIVSSNPDYKL